jgi:hypothetical protein
MAGPQTGIPAGVRSDIRLLKRDYAQRTAALSPRRSKGNPAADHAFIPPARLLHAGVASLLM